MTEPSPPGLRAPEPLAADHDIDAFVSGVAALDEWLRRRARRNETEGASRTFVACAGRRVVGYYSLSAGSVFQRVATGQVRRNMPDPVPAILLGRLAVDRNWQGRGLGADLLHHAVIRVTVAAQTIGVKALFVHAISDEAKAFYVRHGFKESPVEANTLMVTIDEAKLSLGGG